MPGRTAEALRQSAIAGKAWRTVCVKYLRGLGWIGADAQTRTMASDLVGTWDLAVECTITAWDKIWTKLDQAERDARERGLDLWCVWKKRNRSEVEGVGSADPGEGAVIMPAHKFFPLVMRLERLERLELDAAEAYDRGYRNGREAATREAV